MKKILCLSIILLLISGCSLFNNYATSSAASLTNNGSLIFNNDAEDNFCSKANIEKYLGDAKVDGIINEFDISKEDYEQTMKELKQSKEDITSTQCNYTIYSSVSTEESDAIVLISVNGNKNDKVDVNKVFSNSVLENFINNDDIRVNAIVLKELLKDVSTSDFKDLNLKYVRDGKNDIVLYPVFKYYYLKDKSNIKDFQFSGISGFRVAIK
ncbi:MAG: hypothetical protein LBR40_03985 [Bacilli bacterium]|jgi:hypothetical protein|nr:hypothetical protein [Bacilli bacterium]